MEALRKMIQRESAASINESAARWASRIDRGLTPEESAELEEWLAADRRCLGALARAEAAWIHAERAASLGPALEGPSADGDRSNDFDDEVVARPSRRLVMFGGGALAASIAGAVALPRLLQTHSPQQFKTAVGEIRRFRLDDGSMLMLDTASEVTVATGWLEFRVTLVSGRALFDLLAPSAGTLRLETRQVALAAANSSFVVSAIGQLPLSIIVTAGRVAVDNLASEGGVPLAVLQKGMGLDVPIGSEILPSMIRQLPDDMLAGATQWGSGLLTFTGDTLGQAAEMFNRYSAIKINVPDTMLAREPITGVFKSTEPEAFATAIATTLDARAIRSGKIITITR